MKCWEYLVLSRVSLSGLEDELDERGKEGWELVQLIRVNDRLDMSCVFKRAWYLRDDE